MKKILIYLFIVLFLFGCHKKENNEVTIGYLPITADISFFVALEKGFFSQEGINVKPIKFTSSNEAMNSLLTGEIDGAIMIGYSTLITIFSQEKNSFGIIQSGVENEYKYTSRIIVPIKSNITSIEQLKGKVIGTYSGLTQRLNLLLILSKFFDKPEQAIKIVQVGSNLQVPSLAAGQFDALFTIDPYATIAIQEKIGRTISENPRVKYILNPFPTCASVLSRKFLDEQQDKAKKVIRALNLAINWLNENKIKAAKIMSNTKYTNVSIDIADSCGTYKWWKIGEENLNSVQKFSDILFDNNLITNKLNVKNMFVDLSFLSK